MEDAACVNANLPYLLGAVRSVAHEPAGYDRFAIVK
jgi:hypothetical protein